MTLAKHAFIVLEDAYWQKGIVFGDSARIASTSVCGEACFTTAMTGYQESITDPSFRGQILCLTAAHIGNYGINPVDMESERPHIRALLIGELSPKVSNWRSHESLHEFLKRFKVPALRGVDTRALAKRLRSKGAMRAAIKICDGRKDSEQIADLQAAAKAEKPMLGSDFVKEVSRKTSFNYHEKTQEPNGNWTTASASLQKKLKNGEAFKDKTGNYFLKNADLNSQSRLVVAYDFGIKNNMPRILRRLGFKLILVPANSSANEILALKPDALFLSNGPGDPASLDYIHSELKKLIGKIPIFAICLGHQILAHALGAKTFKLKFGHRGANQPVRDERSGKILITSQNHGFAVDADSVPNDIEITHTNLNDGTVEGFRHRKLPLFCVQFHPEAAPGPHDAEYLFEDFAKMIEKFHQNHK